MQVDTQAWLRSNTAKRIVLLEAEHLSPAGTKYIASHPYISHSTDTLSNQPYDDYLTQTPEIISRLSTRTDVGHLDMVNNGELDSWFDYIWQGQPLRLYLGDPAWSRAEFIGVFDGVNGGIISRSRERISFELYDRRRLLDVPVQTNRLGDGALIPLCLGQVFNVEPVLVDAARLIYQVHDGALSDVTAVRDNGIAVRYTKDKARGRFTLTGGNPAGRITCDVSAPSSTAAEMITALAGRATETRIDTAHVNAFPNRDAMGLYIREERTVSEVMDEVMASVGGVYRFDALGKLQLARIDVPAGTADLTLDVDDVLHHGMALQSRELPRAEMSLGFRRNWAVQDADALAGAVSAANRKLYSQYQQIVSGGNSAIVGLDETPQTIATLFATRTGARRELNRRLAMRRTARHVYAVQCLAAATTARLGDVVHLTHPRFGFEPGAKAILVGKRLSLATGRTTLELWR